MYSETIRPKVEKMFKDLRTSAYKVVDSSKTAKEAVDRIGHLVESETSTRSQGILSDMLFELTTALFDDPFFETPTRRNNFRRVDLTQEILDKYQFKAGADIDYQDTSRLVKALEVGGAGILAGVGAAGIEAAVLFIRNRPLSNLAAPLPIGVILAAALVGALIDYYRKQPNRSKAKFKKAVDDYLNKAQVQFLMWFDEIEDYFNMRVGEIKATL